ncbi:MAG: DUF2330 domain-containing protein [Patescibacteria group bacterium]|nr:DUF2330 domain-containing protein [Patescibacteria group bacterium]
MKKIVLIIGLLAIIAIPTVSMADGGIMPPPNHWVAETDQKGVIVFENNTETLILSTSFQGDAKDFAWIVPTPSKPQVDKGPDNIFEALSNLTNVSENGGGIIYSQPLGLGSAEIAPRVNVIEQKKIGIYNIAVLEANDQNALYDWLQQNGYNYPAYGKTILDDYIRNNWYFTAVKINPENLAQAETELSSGTITPLKLIFSSTKIVYPLKISSITMNNPNTIVPVINDSPIPSIAPMPITPSRYVSVRLYVLADHKKQADGFEAQYANWIDTKTIRNLAFDDNGNSWISPKGNKMYLTELYRGMNTKDMKSDIFLIDAEDNSAIPPSQFWYNVLATVVFALLIILSPFGLLYIIFMLLFIFLKSKIVKVTSVVFQALILLVGIITLLLVLSSMSQSYSSDSGLVGILVSSLIIIAAMILGMILEIVFNRRKNRRKKK